MKATTGPHVYTLVEGDTSIGWTRATKTPDGSLGSPVAVRLAELAMELPLVAEADILLFANRRALHDLGGRLADAQDEMTFNPDSDFDALMAESDRLASKIAALTLELHEAGRRLAARSSNDSEG